jgi:hypothetical protein
LIPEIEGNMMHIWLLNDLPHDVTAKILIKNKQQKIFIKKIICAANSKSAACKIDLSKLKINDLNLSIYLKGKKVFERIGF